MKIIKSIHNRIYELRGERVMLDFDLAELYKVATKVLNQSVKRNIKRFPKDFMFQLTTPEWDQLQQHIFYISKGPILRSQNVTSKLSNDLELPSAIIKRIGGNRYLPYAFTEQGIAMLSGVLNSDKAISMNIAIMRAFVASRRLAFQDGDLKAQLNEIREVLEAHDSGLIQIYDALENLLDEKAAKRKWDDRERIGFKKNS